MPSIDRAFSNEKQEIKIKDGTEEIVSRRENQEGTVLYGRLSSRECLGVS